MCPPHTDHAIYFCDICSNKHYSIYALQAGDAAKMKAYTLSVINNGQSSSTVDSTDRSLSLFIAQLPTVGVPQRQNFPSHAKQRLITANELFSDGKESRVWDKVPEGSTLGFFGRYPKNSIALVERRPCAGTGPSVQQFRHNTGARATHTHIRHTDPLHERLV